MGTTHTKPEVHLELLQDLDDEATSIIQQLQEELAKARRRNAALTDEMDRMARHHTEMNILHHAENQELRNELAYAQYSCERQVYRKDEDIKRLLITKNKLRDELANLKYSVSISVVFREIDAIVFCSVLYLERTSQMISVQLRRH